MIFYFQPSVIKIIIQNAKSPLTIHRLAHTVYQINGDSINTEKKENNEEEKRKILDIIITNEDVT